MSRIIQDATLTETRKRDLLSSINVVAKALDLTVGQVPADPDWLRRRLAEIVPARLELTKRTWSNVLCNARAALVHAGVVSRVFRGPQLNGPWQELWDRLDDRNLKISLTRFMTFCSRQGLAPAGVTDETVTDFAQVFRLASLRKDPDLALYYLTTSWNKASARVLGWPAKRLAVPKRRVVFRVVAEALPMSFKHDLARYLAGMACTDPLVENAPPKPLAPVTLGQYRRQILRCFGELVRCGVAPEAIKDLAAMVRPENVEKALRAMIDRRGGGTSMTIYGMAYMLKSIAKHYVQLPAQDIAKLDKMCRSLRVRYKGMTAKNRARLRQFDEPGRVARILNMPAELVAEAQRGKMSPKRCAMLDEMAVAIELLLMTALRIKNLAGLHLDRNIEWARPKRNGICHVVVEASEVKNGQPLEFELDDGASALLRNYIERYRPLLAPVGSRWLFSRRDGNARMSTTVLSHRISTTVRQRTGLDVNPHLFRSLGSKLYLDRHPGGYEVVRRMLGHTSMSTTLQAYTGLESTSAAKHFDQTIRSLRDTAAPRKFRKRPTRS